MQYLDWGLLILPWTPGKLSLPSHNLSPSWRHGIARTVTRAWRLFPYETPRLTYSPSRWDGGDLRSLELLIRPAYLTSDLDHRLHRHIVHSVGNLLVANIDNDTRGRTSPSSWVHRAQAGRFLSHYKRVWEQNHSKYSCNLSCVLRRGSWHDCVVLLRRLVDNVRRCHIWIWVRGMTYRLPWSVVSMSESVRFLRAANSEDMMDE